MKTAKDSALAEITLRKYEKPYNLEDRDLIKKLCLSMGLLQPGDSRDVIVDVFHVILAAKDPIDSKQIEELVISSREQRNLPMLGIASSNIRRQLKRLKDLFFIERISNSYRITENAKLHELFDEKIHNFYLTAIVERVRQYLEEVEKQIRS